MRSIDRSKGILWCLLFIVVTGIFSVIAGPASDAYAGNYTVRWGTDGSNGIGGSVKFNGTAINSGDVVTVSDNDVFTITYEPGYTINSGDIHRYDSSALDNSYQCSTGQDRCKLNQNTKPSTITIKNASNSSKLLVMVFTPPSTSGGDVYTKWGTTNGYSGDGGSVTSAGRAVTNKGNVSPRFGDHDTATFTMVPDSGFQVKSVEIREGGDGNNNWNSLTVTNNQVSFDINSRAWAIRVTFEEIPVSPRSFIAYYGTNAFDLTDANKPDWVGGRVVRITGGGFRETLGTNAYKVSDYSTSGVKTFEITPDTSPAYVIESIQYHKATWTNPRSVTIDGSTSWVSVSADTNGQFTINVTDPDSYIIFVKFKLRTGTGGKVGAWYGTTNTTGFNSPAANGSGGEVWKTSGTDVQLDNGVADAYTTNSDGTRTFTVTPAANFRIVSINYGIGSNPVSWSPVTVGANQTTAVSFDINVTDGNQYVIWVVFASTAASSFTVNGSVDTTYYPECMLSDTAAMISPNSRIVNVNQTGTFTFSTTTACMVEGVNFNTGGYGTAGISGYTYTTPAITANSSFVVRFRPVGYSITAGIDPSTPTGCGGAISPAGTVAVTKGGEQKFTISTGPNCVVSHVYVTDTNKGYSGTDIAPLVPSEYTFKNIQANGSILVKYSEIVPATSDAYCQIPPFVAGQSSLAPNVLIVFDNSGSMGGTDSDGYAYYNIQAYNCTASGTGSTFGSGTCKRFYGYFDPEKMYKVDGSNSNKYLIDTATLDLSSSNGKSGNYLNYRHMHKVDVVRKALMGGRVQDRSAATKFLYTDNSKLIEHGLTAPTGIIHQLAEKVRFGVMVFNNPAEGGHLAKIPNTIPARVAELGSSLTDLIAALEGSDTDPKTNTPIAETLYEAIRYFQAKPSAYNSGVDYGTMDPIQNSCQKHFILLLTDGEPNSSNNLPGYSTHPTMNGYTDNVFNVTTWENRIPASDRADNNNSTCFTPNSSYYKCPVGSGNNCNTNSEKVEAVAFYMHNTDLRSSVYGNSLTGKQNITLFPVYAFGNGSGTKTLQMAAKYGGYNNTNENSPSPNTWPSPDNRNEWDIKPEGGDCVPDNYFEAENGAALEANLMTTMSEILAKVASGTAASILSNSEGSGANMLQAVFFPSKIFKNSTEAKWTGEMQNLWYYVDPFIANSTVREDTDFAPPAANPTTPDHILDLNKDLAADFYFASDTTRVNMTQDTNADGAGDTFVKDIETDDVNSIWRAGKLLHARLPSSRTIHTSIDGYSLLGSNASGIYTLDTYGGFYTGTTRATALQPYLQTANNDANAETIKLINYVRGEDQINYRTRKVSLLASDLPGDWKEWKLGDIVASTPRIQSTIKLNDYGYPIPKGYNDTSYAKFAASANYNNRGMVYVGANDGMLHAFKLGKLTVSGPDIRGAVKATLKGNNLGEEQWAYIPRNALPYLKYLTENTYKHLYYVDGPTEVHDVAIGGCEVGDYSDCPKDEVYGSNWRTVLIGSMGLAGASALKGTTSCVDGADGTCVKTPIFDPADNTKGVGYSSYFALDVTNQYFNDTGNLVGQPILKWEFSHPDLGYATSGAVIVRIGAKDPVTHLHDKSKNGKWFAVVASGPTGPIDTTNHRFMGRSNQNLKLFVIDLGATIDASHPFTLGTNYWVIDTGISHAFAGTINSAAIDVEKFDHTRDGNYQDDALYIGYTKANTATLTATTEWTSGGVIRLLTKEDTNPANWVASPVISGIGPVTTNIRRLQNVITHKLWLYFGTGRYYYSDDDSAGQQRLFGIQDRCYTSLNSLDHDCSTTAVADIDPEPSGKGAALSLSDLAANSSGSCASMIGKKGWYLPLRSQNTDAFLGAERSITDTLALTTGLTLFTTFRPTTDVCKFGGVTNTWAMKYDNGCLPTCKSLADTKIMIQMSTGSFVQSDLSAVFACDAGDGHIIQPPPLPPPPEPVIDAPTGCVTPPCGPQVSLPIQGKPPGPGPSGIGGFLNEPLKKIMHVREK